MFLIFRFSFCMEIMRRPEKLAEVLREEIAEVVGYELEDPRLQAVTVTDVSVSENMRDAKVYVMVEGDENEIRAAMTALRNAAVFVRQQVALSLNLHHAPHLHFVRDTVEESAVRIDQLLGDLTDKGEFEERNEISEK